MLVKTITTSGVVTTAGLQGWLLGWILIGGTTASSVVFKNGGTSGTAKIGSTTIANTAVGDTCSIVMLPKPLPFITDIWATLAGTGAYVYVLYEERITKP